MDIRKPIGLLFSLLGLLLLGAGIFGDDAAKVAKTLPAADTVNINLYWGVVMLVFGLVMLGLALRGVEKKSAAEAQ